jgi:ribosome-associated heat shock protein Hsp15
MTGDTIRIDKLLFFIRLAKSRSLAAAWVDAGHIRVNGHRVERASWAVKIDDVITLPRGDDVLAMKLLAIPARRGPAIEARSCYEVLV